MMLEKQYVPKSFDSLVIGPFCSSQARSAALPSEYLIPPASRTHRVGYVTIDILISSDLLLTQNLTLAAL